MNNSEKEFSPHESISIIRSMIESTKHSISDSSHYFLLWGWAVMIGCLLQYYLMVVANYAHHYYAWFVTPLAMIIHFVFVYQDKKKEKVKTFVGEMNGHLWMIIGFSMWALSFVFSKIGWQYCFPFYILLYGIGTYISGRLLEFKPLVYGGIACLVLVAVTPYLTYPIQMLMAAFAIFISYIIPGYMLRNRYKKSKKVIHATGTAL